MVALHVYSPLQLCMCCALEMVSMLFLLSSLVKLTFLNIAEVVMFGPLFNSRPLKLQVMLMGSSPRSTMQTTWVEAPESIKACPNENGRILSGSRMKRSVWDEPFNQMKRLDMNTTHPPFPPPTRRSSPNTFPSQSFCPAAQYKTDRSAEIPCFFFSPLRLKYVVVSRWKPYSYYVLLSSDIR